MFIHNSSQYYLDYLLNIESGYTFPLRGKQHSWSMTLELMKVWWIGMISTFKVHSPIRANFLTGLPQSFFQTTVRIAKSVPRLSRSRENSCKSKTDSCKTATRPRRAVVMKWKKLKSKNKAIELRLEATTNLLETAMDESTAEITALKADIKTKNGLIA